MKKKGQGLSLDVIIIAALALIVLVVLIVIFTGKAGQFKEKVGEEAKSELISMQAQYARCRPTAGKETSFLAEFTQAGTLDNEQDVRTAKEVAKQTFSGEISRCGNLNDETSCTSAECRWS